MSSVVVTVLGLLGFTLLLVGAYIAGRQSILVRAYEEHTESLKEARRRIEDLDLDADEEITEIHDSFADRKGQPFRERIARLFSGA